MMQAVLIDQDHPEYGQIMVSFPIPDEEYGCVVEQLASLEIGDAIRRDCRVDEFHSAWPILMRLEDTNINLDELDYLAKRLDGFDVVEAAQFQAMTVKRGISDMTDLINLTFCCQKATVITDFSDLEAVGRDHYMVKNGGCVKVDELERLNARYEALKLILNEPGTITPYGVVYDNGMLMAQDYDGCLFPCYHYKGEVLAVGIGPRGDQDTNSATWLYLPAPRKQIERMMERGGIRGYDDARIIQIESSLPDRVETALRMEREGLLELNDLCKAVAPLGKADRLKLDAAVLLAEPEYAHQIRQLAQNLEQFEFIPGIKTPTEYGKYMIQQSGHFEYDYNLDEFYDYEGYGLRRMEQESGEFNDLGYISYHGTMSLDELMMEDPAEQYQKEQGLQMGGMA